jgi:hypothetical protein
MKNKSCLLEAVCVAICVSIFTTRGECSVLYISKTSGIYDVYPACFSVLVVPACGNSTSEGGMGGGGSGRREGEDAAKSRREVSKCDGDVSSRPESSSAPLKGGNQESMSIVFFCSRHLSAIQCNTLVFFAENIIYRCKWPVHANLFEVEKRLNNCIHFTGFSEPMNSVW